MIDVFMAMIHAAWSLLKCLWKVVKSRINISKAANYSPEMETNENSREELA